MSFLGKVIIVTGGSSGIGAGTAERFAKEGGSVAIVGRNMENLQKTVDNCQRVNSAAQVLIVQADVTTDAERIVEETLARFGRIDVLVNNAGILAGGDILSVDVDQFDNVMTTNLRSVFQMTKAVTPHLIKTEGNIVNVSSVAGLRSFSNSLNYCMSKAALDQFTRCTALDLAAHKVRVNSVNPGLIVTNIHKTNIGMDDTTYNNYIAKGGETHALGRVGTPPEVAAAIVFLAGPDATFITGTLLPVDGGKSAICPK